MIVAGGIILLFWGVGNMRKKVQKNCSFSAASGFNFLFNWSGNKKWPA